MSFIRERPLQGCDTGPDFSGFLNQIYDRNKKIGDKIPNWVKTGVKIYGDNEEVFSTFLDVMANIVGYNVYQEDYYFDLFLETASCLKEEKCEDIPLEGLQTLDFTGIFYVHFYFQWIEKQVPEVIDNLYQEKSAEEQAKGKEVLVKENKL